MKKNFQIFILFLSLGITIMISSCGKEWKKPTTVSFNFQLNANSSEGYVKFNECSVILTKLSFVGERNQGDKNVDFDQSFDKQQFTFNQSTNNPICSMDIPQGTYTKINIGFNSDIDLNGVSIQVKGTYIDSLGNSFPVVFRISAPETFLIRAVNTSAGTEINLVEGTPANVVIVLNPTYWFGTLSRIQLDEAAEELVEGEPTIVIDSDSDTDLYSMIAGRLNDGNEVVIK